ncbi:hypothetical protein [Cellulomonas sp. C5510]|uniref:hypothetical protein n=1 Tax=Cellulomonas sp. C5510 TaxID=2871170 RepID=UPI001C960BE1|nr:hypothetical protein [Cellulomonas sp. C5510]QZN86883.1 hypothetical protein K5O09_07170 [Cellulomonas sp. C5510]
MVDLQPLFAQAQQLAADAVRTSGCTVRVFTETSAVDPDTLKTTTSSTTLVEGGALVKNADRVNASLPGLDVRAGDFIVSMLPDTPTPPIDAVVTVVTSLAGAPSGRLGTVRGSTRDAAGALLRVLVRP